VHSIDKKFMSRTTKVIIIIVLLLSVALLGASRFSLQKTYERLSQRDYSSFEVVKYGLKIVATGEQQLVRNWGIFHSSIALNNVQIWGSNGELLADHTDISLEIPTWRLLTLTTDEAPIVLHNGNYYFDRLVAYNKYLDNSSIAKLGLDNIELIGFAEGTTYIIKNGIVTISAGQVEADLVYYDTKHEESIAALHVGLFQGTKGKINIEYTIGGIQSKMILKGALNGAQDHQMTGNFSLNYTTDEYGTSEITGQAQLNNGVLDIANLVSSSPDIQGFNGSAKIDLLGQTDSFIMLAADSLQLDKWWAGILNALQSNKIQDGLHKSLENFDFALPKFLSFTTNISFAETTFGEESLGKFELQGKLNSGEYNIEKLSFGLPQGGQVQVEAVLSHNSIRPKVDGKITLQHPNFGQYLANLSNSSSIDHNYKDIGKVYLQSDFTIIPRSLRLENIKSLVDQLKLKGTFVTRLDGQGELNSYVTFLFNGLDAKSINLEKRVDRMLFELFKADYDKTGEYFNQKTDDFKWLRRIRSSVYFDLQLQNFLFRDQKISNAYLQASIDKGMITLKTAEMAGAFGKLELQDTTISLDAFKPHVIGSLKFKDFDYSKFSGMFNSFSSYKKALKIVAEDEATDGNMAEKFRIDTDFNFFSLHNCDFELSIQGENLKPEPGIEIDKIKGFISGNEGVIRLESMEGDISGGKFKSKGSLVTKTLIPEFSISYQLTGINSEKLFEFATGLNDKLSGYMSIAGNLHSRGLTKNEMWKNLNGKFFVAGRQIKWLGLGMNDIISSTNAFIPITQKQQRIEYYRNNGETSFENIRMNGEINKNIATVISTQMQNVRFAASFIAKYDIRHHGFSSIFKAAFRTTGTGPTKKIVNATLKSSGRTNGKYTVNEDYSQIFDYMNAVEKQRQSGTSKKQESVLNILR
jgi:hypothetical protein